MNLAPSFHTFVNKASERSEYRFKIRLKFQNTKSTFNVIFPAQAERDRNKDVYVTVATDESQLMYDSNPAAICNYHDGPLEQYYTLITCVQPIRGQFVQLQYKESLDSVIRLYEIEVHGL